VKRSHGESARSPDGDCTPDDVAANLAAFVDAVDLRRFSMVEFSFGGQAVFAYAARHPDRVDRVVLNESFLPPDTPRTGPIYRPA
jgi:pimeloyl-ACP methyl ester carboxylesterase